MSEHTVLSVDSYIASFPSDIQAVLRELRKIILAEIPECGETISYQIPAFKKNGKTVIYFGAWKHHVALYPVNNEMLEAYPEVKAYYTSGKGTIRFPYDKPLPKELIRGLIAFRLKELSD